MAAKHRWYQRNGGEFIMGTLHMSIEARLAYSLIIDMLNDRDRPIPDDADFICGFTKLTKQKWSKAREFLLNDRDASGMTRLFLNENGDITNPRFERERLAREEQLSKAQEAGSKGGKKSAEMRQGNLDLGGDSEKTLKKVGEKLKESSKKVEGSSQKNRDGSQENNDLGQGPPQARAREPDTRYQNGIDDSVITPSSTPTRAQLDPVDLSDHLCRIAGVRNIEPKAIARHIEITREWIDLPIPIADIEEIIVRSRDRATANISSLKYFDPAIRRRAAQLEHPSNGTGPSETIDDIADPWLRQYLKDRAAVAEGSG